MSSGTTQHIPADVRERVAREVFTLDADWRREYWDQFCRDFPRIAQAYYDTADRILALRRTPRAEEEAWCAFLDALGDFENAANLWVDPEGPSAEDMAQLDRARQRVIECGRALAGLPSTEDAARRSEGGGDDV